MSDTTNIEWADSTFNPWMGCTKVSPACDHCYAERDTKRFGRVEWGAGKQRIRTSPANWKLPERWNRESFYQCRTCGLRGQAGAIFDSSKAFGIDPRCLGCGDADHVRGVRRRVFCASLADWLDNEVPIEWLVDLLDLIRRTPNLDWILLSKRVGNWSRRIADALGYLHAHSPLMNTPDLYKWLTYWLDADEAPANVWFGATVINQAEADRDVPKLLAVPARVRFLSIEPMLGPVDLVTAGAIWSDMNGYIVDAAARGLRNIDWIIAGGESGPNARPSHPDWYRSLRDQCAAAGVPFLFKQWGEWANADTAGLDLNECYVKGSTGGWVEPGGMHSHGETSHPLGDGASHVFRIGKKAAGRKLDGRTHDGFPVVKP